jgi:transcriptional regulator GlxA family with amidase domain
VKIALVLYPGFTALDIIGPFQVLAYIPGHEAVFVAAQPGPVTDDTGRCQLIASTSLDQLTAPDVVIIGGSLFTKEPDLPVVQWLRQVHPTTTWTTSVCTGSIYLAAAGILDGQDAATHWAWAEQLERRGAHYTEQRVVERGKVITAAGVSSGIDMALTLLAHVHYSSPRVSSWPSNTTPAPLRHQFTVSPSRNRGVRTVAAEHPRSQGRQRRANKGPPPQW